MLGFNLFLSALRIGKAGKQEELVEKGPIIGTILASILCRKEKI